MEREAVYLMVLVEVESEHQNISDTVHELESQAVISVSDTPKVKVLITEILLTRTRNRKRYGTQY